VLRVFHSAVVSEWRERERELTAQGAEVVLVSAARWDEGGRVVPLDLHGDDFVLAAPTVGRHPYRFAYDPRPLWRVLRAGAFDVIDVHEEPASVAAAEVCMLVRLAGQRAAVSLYSAQNIDKRYPPPFRWWERALLRRVAAVHTCNDAAGRVLRRKGFSGIVANLGLGVDIARFDAVPKDTGAPGARPGQLHVGYVGRLEAHKGVGVLIDAVAATPEVTLTIVGDGPARGEVEASVRSSGAIGRIALDGFVSHDDLPATYRRFDVVAVPSLDTPGWIEQFGRVAVEAMASGAVVVASSSGALPEVVGDAGLLVPPGDVAGLAVALAELRDDPDRLERLRVAGRARAEHYGWATVAARQLALYDTMRGAARLGP
jgi:glycosyltransferase involved in cell wall biosynthesis